MAVNDSNEAQSIDVHVNPEEDDLDNDTGMSQYSMSTKNQSKKGNRSRNTVLSITQFENNRQFASKERQENTPVSKAIKSVTPNTKNQSVAKRLDMLPPPTFNRPPPKSDDSLYIVENNRVETLLQAEKEKLAHTQREAELARKQLEAETTRQKTCELEKQLQKDRKKMDQEKARYEREINKNSKSKKTKAQQSVTSESYSRWENQDGDVHDEQSDNNEPVNANQRVKALNPLRRAHLTLAGMDGSNNPNIPGANNGMNAWVDVAMHGKDMDREIIYDARYAKNNADNSMFYDIDDVPTRGPPKIPDLDRSIEELTETAKRLLNDQHVSVCRNTGIMKSTVSIPNDAKKQKRSPKDAKRKNTREPSPDWKGRTAYQNPKYERYANIMDQGPQGWDSESDMVSTSDCESNAGSIMHRSEEHNHGTRSQSRRYDRHDNYRSDHGRRETRERQQGNRRNKQDSTRNLHWEEPKQPRQKTKGRKAVKFDACSSDSDGTAGMKSRISAKPTSNVCEQL